MMLKFDLFEFLCIIVEYCMIWVFVVLLIVVVLVKYLIVD